MATQTPTIVPSTGVDNSASGTLTWSTPSNITTGVTANYATFTASGTATTHYLQGSSFGFNIPLDATILGIQFTINRKRSGGTAGSVKDNSIRLVHNSGTLSANDYAVPATNWVTSDTSVTYGTGTTDLWGDSWTAADINGAGFGAVVQAAGNAASDRVGNVSLYEITVYYTSSAPVFLEPGGDSTFSLTSGQVWSLNNSTATIVTDFVHGTHQKSIKFAPASSQYLQTYDYTITDTGSRLSFYLYINALPTATASICNLRQKGGTTNTGVLRLTTGGVLQLWNSTTGQIGTNGSTLSTGVWYRISLAYTITSTTVNRFELFVNNSSSISVTNATLTNISSSTLLVGNTTGDTILDFRISDVYVDNSNSLTDIASDVWVTAKRPFSNGTTNGFTTQIGISGSGYGSGHAPQVNERPLSTTNGWSMIGAGSAVTEEYTIEGASTGDINTTGATLLGMTGWIYASSLAGETATMIMNNNTQTIPLTSSNTWFTYPVSLSSYPGGGTDIGMITTTALTTVSLYECGVMIAYNPTAVVSSVVPMLATLGVGS